jgi:hypothetical protein
LGSASSPCPEAAGPTCRICMCHSHHYESLLQEDIPPLKEDLPLGPSAAWGCKN